MTKDITTTPFAVIETGAKQYVVTEGDVIKIEKLSDATIVGDKVTFDQVLLTDTGAATTIGAPLVKGATVQAEVVETGRDKKVIAVRYQSKSNYFKRNGHRQPFTKVKITKIA